MQDTKRLNDLHPNNSQGFHEHHTKKTLARYR